MCVILDPCRSDLARHDRAALRASRLCCAAVMRRPLVVLLPLVAFLAPLLFARPGRADDVPTDFPRLVLDTGRPAAPTPDPDTYRLFLHGEHQVRYQAQRSFTLIATPSDMNRKPGLVED